MTRLTDKGLDRKKEIFHAAFLVFLRSGFKDAKVENIAKEAGIGKGTIYHYFGSKEEILSQMTAYYMDEYFEKIKEIFSSQLEFKGMLNQWLEFNLICARSHHNMVNLFRGNGIAMPPDVQKSLKSGRQEIVSIMKDILKREEQNGGITRIRDRDIAVSMIIGTVEQYFYYKKSGHSKIEMDIDAPQPCQMMVISEEEKAMIKTLSQDIYKMLEVL